MVNLKKISFKDGAKDFFYYDNLKSTKEHKSMIVKVISVFFGLFSHKFTTA